jgi:hypothetical protein
MEATIGRKTVNDDAAAALRRGFGFAALFGLAGVAAIACTARVPQPATGIATDRLLAQEALWNAEVSDAPEPAFAPALLERRGDPAVAKAIMATRRQLIAVRAAATARRDAVLRQLDDARAARDLAESRNAVVMMKLDGAFEQRAKTQQRHDTAALATVDADIRKLKIDLASIGNDVVVANRTVNALGQKIAAYAAQDKERAAQHLSDVRKQLRGG